MTVDDLRAWFKDHWVALARGGYRLEFTESPRDRAKRSATVIIATSHRIGQLVVWDTGEAQLSMGDVDSAVIIEEYREITSNIGLRDATETIVAWLRGA